MCTCCKVKKKWNKLIIKPTRTAFHNTLQQWVLVVKCAVKFKFPSGMICSFLVIDWRTFLENRCETLSSKLSRFSFSHCKVQYDLWISFFIITNQRQKHLSNFVLLMTTIRLPVSFFGAVPPKNQKLPKLLLATKVRCPGRSQAAERFVETPHLALWQKWKLCNLIQNE